MPLWKSRLQSRLPEIQIGHCDKPVWSASRKGNYVSSNTWDASSQKKENRGWLVIGGSSSGFLMLSPTKLLSYGWLWEIVFPLEIDCPSGGIRVMLLKAETTFYFKSGFCFPYLEGRHATLQYGFPSFLAGCDWCDRSWKSKPMVDVLSRLVLSSTVYNLWHTRNEIKHNGHPKTEEQAVQNLG
jgi:hypothetical protein